MVSLGCAKALVDSERVLTDLRAQGYVISATYQDADLVIVNTCGFITPAVEESYAAISDALAENGQVIVMGCLAKESAELQARFPEVLAVIPANQEKKVVETVQAHLPPPPAAYHLQLPASGLKLTPAHYAYLKIAEGCNHRCRFCIIPSLRGDLVSRPIAAILEEAAQLAARGVKELLIISQDTSAYGVDRHYRTGFWRGRPLKSDFYHLAEALHQLGQQTGMWIRLHYVYPYPQVAQVLPLMADFDRLHPDAGGLLPYLDMPLQHGSPAVLKAMRRPAAAEKTLERLQDFRQQCPDLTIRSTFIVGFPGETDADFQQLLDFLTAAQLDRLGVFPYDAIAGAEANQLPNPVPETLKQERLAAVLAHQEAISAKRLQARVGQEVSAVLELSPQNNTWQARSISESPEVDGIIHLLSWDDGTWQPGLRVRLRLVESAVHDLWAQVVSSLI
jgi:ribosomal protein S12 methylthiotransferase